MKPHRLVRALKWIVFVVLAVTLFSFVVMSLWNWLMPALFGSRLITFWQALGVLILSKILFGGFRGGPGARMHWRRRMMERWSQMSPEEREKFLEGTRGRCGGFTPRAPQQPPA